MPDSKYRRPPIVEAVIELRFKSSTSPRNLERIRNKFRVEFPGINERRSVDVTVGPDGAQANSELDGYVMRGRDAADAVICQRQAFGMSRKAPYEGWDTFLEKAQNNFEVYKRIANPQGLTRIGARFINRIDIPQSTLIDGNIGQFIKFNVRLPKEVAPKFSHFYGVVVAKEATTGKTVRVVGGLAPAALLDHISINLDIDAFDEDKLPSRTDAIWARFEALHQAKNMIFEACITDQTRELFS